MKTLFEPDGTGTSHGGLKGKKQTIITSLEHLVEKCRPKSQYLKKDLVTYYRSNCNCDNKFFFNWFCLCKSDSNFDCNKNKNWCILLMIQVNQVLIKKIQDNDYYQDFSYVIQAADSINVWKQDVLKIITSCWI